MTSKLFLRALGSIAIVLTIFPFIPVDSWIIRIFDFPHLQLTLLTMVALLVYFLKFDLKNKGDYIFVGILTCCFIFQTTKIYPYTAFAAYEVQNGDTNSLSKISLYTANVLQKNQTSEVLLKDIVRHDTDVVLLTETNERWKAEISEVLHRRYRYRKEVPLENTYGMSLYSKYALTDVSVRFLVEDTIPSIHAKLLLKSGDTIQLLAIHPTPPTPQHNPSSVERDAEMMNIADISRRSKYPVIVLGDFNDVAWSETTQLFQSVSGLLDLRKGRGFFSTYNAKSWIMRWPLDHVFTSPEFRVLNVALGPYIGSDHFPLYTVLSFEPGTADDQRLSDPSSEELKEAAKQLKKGKEQAARDSEHLN